MGYDETEGQAVDPLGPGEWGHDESGNRILGEVQSSESIPSSGPPKTEELSVWADNASGDAAVGAGLSSQCEADSISASALPMRITPSTLVMGRTVIPAPVGENNTPYSPVPIKALMDELLGVVERERLDAKPTAWYSLEIKRLIRRIANLRGLLSASTQATRSESWCSDMCEDRHWEGHDE